MPPLLSRGCVAIRHPGQVPQSGTRAGIQKQADYIEPSLDSGSRPLQVDSSGMTGSANCGIVSNEKGGHPMKLCISRWQAVSVEIVEILWLLGGVLSPVGELKAFDPLKVSHIVGDQHQILGQSRGCNNQIEII